MTGIVALAAVFAALGISIIITRMASIALTLTGLSRDVAQFQARSAFSGIGFTTEEAEAVVNHPVRRRIIMMLMLAQNAGLVTVIVSLVISFTGPGGVEKLYRLGYLFGGVGVLWLIARSRVFDRMTARIIRAALQRWTDLDVCDYYSLLRLSGGYTVMEVRVRPEDWVASRQLQECRLPDEGLNVLGILREDGSYVGVPRKDTRIEPGDTLIIYGRAGAIESLDRRRSGVQGDAEHEEAVRRHREAMERAKEDRGAK